MIRASIVFVVPFVLLGMGCGSSDTTPTTTDTGTKDTGSPADTSDTGTADTGPLDTGPDDTGPDDTGDTGTPDTGFKTYTIKVGSGGNTFDPVTQTIKKGDTVKWQWYGSAPHSVTSGNASDCTADGKFASALQSGNTKTFIKMFPLTTTAGDYPYHCSQHCGAGMRGKIVVSP